MVSARVRRRASAWALPRPSAIASAKLAKITVNASQATTRPPNTLVAWVEEPKSLIQNHAASTVVTSTVNMTGFRIMWRGLSFRNASTTARRRSAGSVPVIVVGERRTGSGLCVDMGVT